MTRLLHFLGEHAPILLAVLALVLGAVFCGAHAVLSVSCKDACAPHAGRLTEGECYCNTGFETWTRRALP